MRRVRLTRLAADDIKNILRRSESEFGEVARGRYKALIDRAIQDLAEDPGRIGCKGIEDVRPGYFIYHIKWAKARLSGPSVRQPRHLLVCSIDGDAGIIVAAVVHERELLERHLDGM